MPGKNMELYILYNDSNFYLVGLSFLVGHGRNRIWKRKGKAGIFLFESPMAEAGVVVLYANPNVSNHFRLRAVAALHYIQNTLLSVTMSVKFARQLPCPI
jgi:hypothetical protein